MPFRFSVKFSLLILSFLALSAGARDSDGAREQLRASQRELRKARESLHEAHRELAAKAERITELEAQLKQAERRKAPVTAKPSAKPSAKPVTTLERDKAVAGAGEKARRVEAGDPLRSFTIQYDRHTAVNYDGREAALHWLREQPTEGGASVRIHLTGWANESEYPEVNQLIATNRARYLAEFFKIRGIPNEVILTVSGKRSAPGDDNGRRTVITVAAKGPFGPAEVTK